MIFKNLDRHSKEFWEIDPKLRLMLCDAEFYLKKHGHELIVTSLLRTEQEQRDLVVLGAASSMMSVHLLGRGGDARPTSDENVNRLLLIYINDKYVYDPKRTQLRSLIRHEGTKDHWHFQCLRTEKGV